MKTRVLDLSPDSHYVKSVVNTSITVHEAVSELIDNPWDAGASSVYIDISKDSIVVRDDGVGCSDLADMLAFGKHRNHTSTTIGRYGVGLKNAVCGMGEIVSISSVCDNILRTAEVYWPDVEEKGWRCVTECEHDRDDSPSGTVVEIGMLHRGIYKDKLLESLEFSFAPAIWSGKKIIINGEPISAWEPKIESDKIEAREQHESLDIGFSLSAGITDYNEHEPFILAYSHRILGANSAPCGKYNTSSKFIALVRLHGKDWPLLKHKDGLRAGACERWLNDRLFCLCEPLLKKVDSMGDSVILEGLACELEETFNSIRGKARRPNKSGEEKSATARHSGRTVKEASEVGGEGNVRSRNSGGAWIKFNLVYDKLPSAIIGKVDFNGKRVCVRLNESHPFIAAAKEAKNLDVIRTHGVYLFCNHQARATDKRQIVFPFVEGELTESDRFVSAASMAFNHINLNRKAA